MKRRVILLGPPGSGKGTTAIYLQETFGIEHLSSGHWLRKEAETGSALGRRVQSFIEKGELVPDEIILEFMRRELDGERLEAGFLLDGFPRTLPQAKALDAWLEQRERPVDGVLFFSARPETILGRITGRRICPNCGRVYHLQNKPPLKDLLCDVCGVALVQREDDSEPVVLNRLDVYNEVTKPLVAYYRDQGKLVVLDANQAASELFSASVAAFKS